MKKNSASRRFPRLRSKARGLASGLASGFRPERNILRYPRLDTVLMIEEAVRKAREYPTKKELWQSLPKKTMYQTFNLVMDYLEYSGKIYIDPRDGRIVWVWDPEKVRHYLSHPELEWKKGE